MLRYKLVDYKEKIIDLRHGQFQVQLAEGGTGPNLFYLHGASGYTGWAPFLDHLAETFHIIAPAQPGVANSTGLQYLDNLWDLIIFYEDLIHELDLGTFQLFGDGYGGMIAAELAAHRPDMVSRLALIAPLGMWLENHPTLDIFALTPSQRSQLEWFNPDNRTSLELLDQPHDQLRKLEQELVNTQTAQAISKFMWPIADHGLIKRAHRISMPTLLIWGDSDQVVPLPYADAFQNLLTNVELSIIEKCGHVPHLERPDRFYDSLIRFLLPDTYVSDSD